MWPWSRAKNVKNVILELTILEFNNAKNLEPTMLCLKSP